MSKSLFRRRLIRATLWLLSGFLLLFGFRMLYSYTSNSRETDEGIISDFFERANTGRRNYASEKTRSTTSQKSDAGGQVSDAPAKTGGGIKYEKTATIKSRSKTFADDEKKLRGGIDRFEGIIQFEENTGRTGDRELHLLIGVAPEKFDSCFAALKTIGNVRTADVTKVDKTSEYKNLNARRASLEKTRESLIEFKRQNGRIEEFMSLQNRILEIEEELQSLGVQLGDFAEENEFCTIRFSLVEGSGPAPISLLHRLKVCFEWTAQYYLVCIGCVLLAVASGFFLLLFIEKGKLFVEWIKKRVEKNGQ